MAFIVGIIIGVVLGLTGAGGSVFAVPLLIHLLHLPVQQAIGLSLGAVATSALFGSLTQLRTGHIQWLPALVYAVIGSLVAPLGNWANQKLDDTLLLSGFALLVIIIALRMWRQASRQPEQTLQVRASLGEDADASGAICRLNQRKAFKIGLPCVLGVGAGAVLTGFLSGLFGVGGGFLIVPTLLFLTGISIRQAVATSLVIIAAISTSGFASFLLSDTPLSMDLLWLTGAGGIAGMVIGVFSSRYIAGPMLQKLFAVLMLLMAIVTLYTQLSQ